jgi:hypothetical protein
MPRPICLVVDAIFPPIPTRAFDWCAYQDGREESGEYGRGATREAAIADYFENYYDGDND